MISNSHIRILLSFIFALAISQTLADCPANCYDCDTTSNQCMGCQPGYFLDSTSGSCTVCPSNCQECLSATMCTFCQSGAFPVYNQSQISCQSSCPSGPNTTCCSALGYNLRYGKGFINFTNMNALEITNNASIAVNSPIITQASLSNSGRLTIQGALFAKGAISDSGELYVSRAITTENGLSNSGTLISSDSVNSTQSLSNSGTFSTNGSVISGGDIENSNTMNAEGDVTAGGDLSNSGQMSAKTVNAKGKLTSSGDIGAGSVNAGNGLEIDGKNTGIVGGPVEGIPSNSDPVLMDMTQWNFGCSDQSSNSIQGSGKSKGNGDVKLALGGLSCLLILLFQTV